MTPLQCGYYINLLAHAWLNKPPGHIPNDPDLIWKLAHAKSRKDFEREGTLVMSQFKLARGGKTLCSPRLVHEMRVLVLHRSEKRIAGRAGATSRWKNKLDGSAMVLPLAENGSSSSSSSSIATATSTPTPTPARAPVESVFAIFWKAYPRKTNESAAFRAWVRCTGIHDHIEEILTVIMRYETSGLWDDKSKIPSAENFIRDKRWRDEVPQNGGNLGQQNREAAERTAKKYGIERTN